MLSNWRTLFSLGLPICTLQYICVKSRVFFHFLTSYVILLRKQSFSVLPDFVNVLNTFVFILPWLDFFLWLLSYLSTFTCNMIETFSKIRKSQTVKHCLHITLEIYTWLDAILLYWGAHLIVNKILKSCNNSRYILVIE